MRRRHVAARPTDPNQQDIDHKDAENIANSGSSVSQQSGHFSTVSTKKQRALVPHTLPPFPQWQAQHLATRDLLFGVVLLLMYFIYLYKTVPDICGFAALNHQQHDTYSSNHQQQQRAALWFSRLCSQSDTKDGILEGRSTWQQNAAAVALNALKYIARAAVTFFAAPVISGDPLHIVVPLLRIAALLLLLIPLPFPNILYFSHSSSSSSGGGGSSSSSRLISWYHPNTYWQQPKLRSAMIAAQRLLPAAVAAASKLSRLHPTAWYTVFMAKPTLWRLVGKYSFQGWTACMLMLPSREHMVVSFFEWMIHNVVYSVPDSSGSSSSGGGGSGVVDVYYILASAFFVSILPTLVVLWLEGKQKQHYMQLQHSMHSAAAAAGTQSASSSSKLSTLTLAQHERTDAADRKVHRQDSNSSSDGGSSGGSGSRQLQSRFSSHSGKSITLELDDLVQDTRSDHPRRSISSPAPITAPDQMQVIDGSSSDGSSSSSSMAIRSISSPLAVEGVTAGRDAATPGPDSPAGPDQSYQAQPDHCQASAAAAAASRSGSSSGTLSHQLLADINSSLQLAAAHTAAAAAAGGGSQKTLPQVPPSDLLEAASTAAGLGGQWSSSSSTMQAIRSLLADEAAEVFAAAAANAAAAVPAIYTGLAGSLPVSMKVHAHNASVSALGPVLNSVLHYQLSPYNTAAAPLEINAAAFAGCVQLVANVMGLKDCSNADGDAAASGSSSMISSSNELAVALLQNAVKAVLQQGKLDVTSPMGDLPAAAAAAAAGESRKDSTAPCSSDRDVVGQDPPRIDVLVGHSAVSMPSSSGDVTTTDHQDQPVVKLQYCEPVCLVTGQQQQQQIRLHLTLSGLSHQQAAAAAVGHGSGVPAAAGRVIVFKEGSIILDQQVQLSEQISTVLPPLKPGVVHITLLNSAKPAPAAAAAAAATAAAAAAEDEAASASSHAPLLLQPLLVLPAAAAAELQRHWQQQLAAAADADLDTLDNASSSGSSSSSDVTKAAVWCYSMQPLTVDIAYLLGVCNAAKAATTSGPAKRQQQQGLAAAAAAAAAKVPVPPAVRLVLRHLLIHLAACGMWSVLQYIVDTAAAVYCKGQAAAAAAPPLGSSAAAGDGSSTAMQAQIASSSSSSTEPGVACKQAHHSTESPKALAEAAADSNVVTKVVTKPVTRFELLWGFRDPRLEARYQAAAFSNSGMIDLVSCLFYGVFSTGAYRAKGAAAILQQQQQQQQLLSGWLRFNEILCVVLNVWGPVAVLLLRWIMQRRLKQQQQQPTVKPYDSSSSGAGVVSDLNKQQQQQQGQQFVEPMTTQSGVARQDTSSSSSSSTNPKQQQQQQRQGGSPADLETLDLANAAQIKQIILAVFISTVLFWGALLLADAPGLITPVVLIKAWSKRGWSQDFGAIVSLAIRACTTQIPFSWLLPVAIVQVMLNVIGSIKYGLTPWYWMLIRYPLLLVVMLGVAAVQQVTGRRRFCIQNKLLVA